MRKPHWHVVVLFILACTFCCSKAGPPSSSIRCKRLQLPTSLSRKPAGVFNPSFVQHPTRGWIGVLRHDKCFYETCGVFHTESRPLIVYLGKESAPRVDLPIRAESVEPWDFDRKSYDKMMASVKLPADRFIAADYR